MIAVKCPHCQVGLKIDEAKIPKGLSSFKCPKCKQPISTQILSKRDQEPSPEAETQLVAPRLSSAGRLRVVADTNTDTPEQEYTLYEGVVTLGRKSAVSKADIAIVTADRSMSREHIRIEIKKEPKGGYKHYLSDNNSKNHTLYNGTYLKEGEVVVLGNQDEIVIGHTALLFIE